MAMGYGTGGAAVTQFWEQAALQIINTNREGGGVTAASVVTGTSSATVVLENGNTIRTETRFVSGDTSQINQQAGQLELLQFDPTNTQRARFNLKRTDSRWELTGNGGGSIGTRIFDASGGSKWGVYDGTTMVFQIRRDGQIWTNQVVPILPGTPKRSIRVYDSTGVFQGHLILHDL